MKSKSIPKLYIIHSFQKQAPWTINQLIVRLELAKLAKHTPITFQVKFLNIQNNFPDHHYIYTDRSKQGMKVGCADIFQNQELLKHLPNESSIYIAEVTAIDLAMNIVANHKSSKFIIYSDSKSVLQALQNKNTSIPLITRLLKIISLFSPQFIATLVYMEMKGQIKPQNKHC